MKSAERPCVQTRRIAMSLYQVVDPATGDVVKEYPTATDEQVEACLLYTSDAADE